MKQLKIVHKMKQLCAAFRRAFKVDPEDGNHGFSPEVFTEGKVFERQVDAPIKMLTQIDEKLLEPILASGPESAFEDIAGESVQLLLVLEYVLISNCFQRFELLPILWLYVPDPILLARLLEALPQLCFNGNRVYPYDRMGNIRRKVEQGASMLIFSEPSEYSKWVKGYWLDYSVDRGRAKKKFGRAIYSPITVISKSTPPNSYLLHTIEITHPALDFSRIFEVDSLGDLKKMFVAIASRIKQFIPVDSFDRNSAHPYDIQLLALRSINRALKKGGYISEKTEEAVNLLLDQHSAAAARQSPNISNLIIGAVALYLDRIHVRREMKRRLGFVALYHIVQDLQHKAIVPPNYSEWSLSVLLNRDRLVLDSERGRIEVEEMIHGEAAIKTKQVTFVKIDGRRLTQIRRNK